MKDYILQEVVHTKKGNPFIASLQSGKDVFLEMEKYSCDECFRDFFENYEKEEFINAINELEVDETWDYNTNNAGFLITRNK